MIGSSRHTPDIQRIEPRAAKQSVEQRERAVTSAATASAAMLGAKTSKLRQEGSYSTSAQCNGIGTEGVRSRWFHRTTRMEPMQTTFRLPASARRWLVPTVLVIFAVAGCASAPSIETKAPAPSIVGTSQIPPAVSDEVEHSQKFARWVAEFSTIARAAGIDEATLQIAFDDVRFIPSVIELDRAQPEFTRTVWDYLDGALSTQRIARGQDKFLQLRPEVDTIAARYG